MGEKVQTVKIIKKLDAPIAFIVKYWQKQILPAFKKPVPLSCCCTKV